MRSRDVLTYAYEQVAETLTGTVEGLGPDDLARRVGPGANPIGWLAWHLLRVQDDHVAEVAGTEQVWTVEFLRGLSDDDLDRVVDTNWDPPVTLGVRLVSVLSDDLQHLGQAAYVRGLLGR